MKYTFDWNVPEIVDGDDISIWNHDASVAKCIEDVLKRMTRDPASSMSSLSIVAASYFHTNAFSDELADEAAKTIATMILTARRNLQKIDLANPNIILN